MSFINSDLYKGPGKPTAVQLESQQQALVLEEDARQTLSSQSILQESLRVAAQTNAVAQSTVQELRGQTDQIHRIHRDVAETNVQLNTTEYLINGMQSWWTAMKQVFVPPPASADHQIGKNAPSRAPVGQKAPEESLCSANPQLRDLANMLDEMKCRAKEAKKEVKYQIDELGEIGTLVESNERKLNTQRRNLDTL